MNVRESTLDAEIAALQPEVIVCMGTTAQQTLLGKDFRVTQHRGEFQKSPRAPFFLATVHPPSILRAPGDRTRRREMKCFITDIKKIKQAVA